MNRIISMLVCGLILISSIGAQENFSSKPEEIELTELVESNESNVDSMLDTSHILIPPPEPGVFFSLPDPYLDFLFLDEDDNISTLDESITINEENETPGIWLHERLFPIINTEEIFEDSQNYPVSESFIREASMSIGQVLEIFFPASGWVYVGDALAFYSVLYQNRKLDTNDTIFFFKAMKEGESMLRFSRYDVLTDAYTEEFVRVVVSVIEKESSASIILHYSNQKKEIEEEAKRVAVVKDLPKEGSKDKGTSSVFFDEPEIFAVEHIINEQKDTIVLLSEIQNKLKDEAQEEVLSLLQDFFAGSVQKLDEAWFIQGQAYELQGPKKNILKALDSYTLLTESYPDSEYWEKADERIRYIKRMYLQTR